MAKKRSKKKLPSSSKVEKLIPASKKTEQKATNTTVCIGSKEPVKVKDQEGNFEPAQSYTDVYNLLIRGATVKNFPDLQVQVSGTVQEYVYVVPDSGVIMNHLDFVQLLPTKSINGSPISLYLPYKCSIDLERFKKGTKRRRNKAKRADDYIFQVLNGNERIQGQSIEKMESWKSYGLPHPLREHNELFLEAAIGLKETGLSDTVILYTENHSLVGKANNWNVRVENTGSLENLLDT